MEYIAYHGEFDDVPAEFIFAGIRRAYPNVEENLASLKGRTLERDLSESPVKP
jgi:hypothetical protein